MALVGDPIPTGCAFIDRETRHGGIPPGKLILVGGPPQSGKSLLFAQFMVEMSRQAKVYTLMADAGWEDTCVSIGSLLGMDKAKIEKNPAGSAPEIAERLAETPITHINPEHPDATLLKFFEFVAKDCPSDQTPVVFVDSAQAIRHGLDNPPDDKSVPEIVGAMCRGFATRNRAVVFLSSKANRVSWKNRRREENTVALSAFMGGDYEYTADVALVLSLTDKATGFLGLEWAKNRLGNPHPPNVPLRFDTQNNRLQEVDDAEIDAAESTENNNRLGPIKLKIRAQLKNKPPISKNAIVELVPGKRTDILAAVNQLIDEKTIDVFPSHSGRGMLYQLIDRAPITGTTN